MLRVGAEVDLGHIYIPIRGEDHAEILLRSTFAGGGKLHGGAHRGRLGGLPAGVGVKLVVKHQHVEIEAGGHHVVEAAVTDVVSPAVSADHPNRLFCQRILAAPDILHMLTVIIGIGEGDAYRVGHQNGLFIVVPVIEPCLESGFEHLVTRRFNGGAGVRLGLFAELVHGEIDAEGEFGVVFKQGVGEGRAEAAPGHRLREGGSEETVGLRTARGIGGIHPVSEKLSKKFDVRRFPAAGAGAGELVERLFILAALGGEAAHRVDFLGKRQAVLPVLLFKQLGLQRGHGKSLFLGRAGADAAAAALAVEHIYLNAITQVLKPLADSFLGRAGFGSGSSFRFREEEGTDGGMRADERAAVAADAFGGIPNGHIVSHAALFKTCGIDGHHTVGIVFERADRQQIAFSSVHRDQDLTDIFRQRFIRLAHFVFQGSPALRNIDLHCIGEAAFDGGEVHADDLFAFFGEGLHGGFFHILFRLVDRQHAGELEKGGLQHGARAVSEAHFRCDAGGIDGVEAGVTLGKEALGAVCEVGFQLLALPVGIQQEGAAFLDFVGNVKSVHIALLVAGHKISHCDVVAAADGLVAEAQVASCQSAGLFRIILEVGLHVLVGIVADDLAGILVGADGAVGSEPPEFAGNDALTCRNDILSHGEGSICYVVHDADGEVVFLLALHVVINSLELGGGGVLGAQPVAAAEHANARASGFKDRRSDILVQWLSKSAGLLGAVQRGEHSAAFGDGGKEVLHGERAVQVDLDEADLFSSFAEIIHHFAGGFTDGTHCDDHTLRIRRAEVIEEFVTAPRESGHFVHILFHNIGKRQIRRVHSFAVLEEDVVILAAVADGGVLGVEGAVSEFSQLRCIEHLSQVGIVQHIDLLDLVAGAEAVEKVLHGQMAFDCGKMRHRAEIHAFLHAGGGKLCPACLAAGHHILMVAENGDGRHGDAACCNMHDGRQQQTGDAVHRRDHQHQALGGSICGSQRAGFQSTLHGGAGAGFSLHLHQLDGSSKEVLFPSGCPLVHMVGHGARRRDGIYGGYFGKCVTCVCGGFIAVHRFSHHDFPPYSGEEFVLKTTGL